MMKPPARVVLEGRFVRLEPLEERHGRELRAICDDSEIWQWSPVDANRGPFHAWLDTWLARSLAAPASKEIVFVVRRRADARVVGSTRFLNIEVAHHKLEIGGTWYVADARATAVNPECKLLLMAHAFEALGARRVEFKCDARNARSRAALAKLGAVEEGTLRGHMTLGDDYQRDSTYFSVVEREWPSVKARLAARLSAS